MNTRSTFAILSLGLLVVAGCQSANMKKGFVGPGTGMMPGVRPAVETGALSAPAAIEKTPAATANASAATKVPALETTAMRTELQPPVSQVGFVDRLRAGCGNAGCNGCQSCESAMASDCESCQNAPIEYPMMPMARPVDPQEYLCNGADQTPKARVTDNDMINGLEPQDAVVHYTTDAGDIHVQESSRVCVYSPRFGAVRQVTGAVAGEKSVGLSNTYQPLGPTGIGYSQPSLMVGEVDELAHADVTRRIDAMKDRNRGVPVENSVQLLLAEDVLQILATLDFTSLANMSESQIAVLQQGALAAQSWTIRDAVEVMIESMAPPVLTRDARVESFVEYDFPDAGRLEIIKVADKNHAQLGEVVTFAIHVQNVGDSAVNQVEIADSLVPRLEYIEDSETCDREAEFTSRENSSGSLRMSWKLKEPIAVGEVAKIEFKCRVR